MKKNISMPVMTASAVDATETPAPPAAADATSSAPRYHAVVGLDVGDRQSHYCVLDLDGSVLTEVRSRPRRRRCACCSRGKAGCASRWKPGRIRPGSVDH